MKRDDLIKKLNNFHNRDVVVRVENGLYLPIKDIVLDYGSIVLICKDITKVGGKEDEKIS